MSGDLPPVDTLVVGAGIVGTCVALQLQCSGRSVALVERGTPGEEASGHNGGAFSGDCLPTGMPQVIKGLPRLLRDPYSPLAIRWQYLPRLAPWLVRFAMASRPGRVEQISAALGSLMVRGVNAYRPLVAGTDAEAMLRSRGFLFGYQYADPRVAANFSLELRRRRGIEFEILDAPEIAKRSPILAGRFQHGVYLPSAYFTVDPGAFTRTLVAQFVARGGRFEQAAVNGFSFRNGTVQAVLTSAGPRVVGSVVIAAGPWSNLLLRHLGTDVPLDVERGYGVDLPDPGLQLDFPVVVGERSISITPFRNGLRVTGLDELAGISAPPNIRLVDRIIHGARAAFPELRTNGATTWMRRRPSMPDSLPIIGRAPKQRNVYLAFGHGHKGLCMGAITGQLIKELMDGQRPSIDVAPFSPNRFTLLRST